LTATTLNAILARIDPARPELAVSVSAILNWAQQKRQLSGSSGPMFAY
jgi:hypothetical protein